MLAHAVAKQCGKPMLTDLLNRVRNIRSQVGLAQGDRDRNVRGAFSLADRHAGEVPGKRIVLVDDVMTSGATAGESASALRRAGAAQVEVLVFALVSNSG